MPTNATLNNYRTVFERDYFWTAMRNSALVTLTVVFLALAVGFLAALALSRFRFRGRVAFIVAVIAIQMIPAEALIISLFQVLDGRELTNRIIGLSLTYLIFVLPFTIWTLRGFVSGVPLELEEAARVDGASRFGAFMRVTLPLVAPGLVATGIFAFILAWNEFIFALVIMNRPETQTAPVWLQAFNEGARGTNWGGVMAGSTVLARARRDLLPPRPAQGHGRPHRGRGEGLTVASRPSVSTSAAPRPGPCSSTATLRAGRRRGRRRHRAAATRSSSWSATLVEELVAERRGPPGRSSRSGSRAASTSPGAR